MEPDKPKIVIMLHSLLHNKHIMNNDIEVLYYVVCSTEELAKEIFELMGEVQPYTTARSPVPDELEVKMNQSKVTNLWKYSRKLADDLALLRVELIADAPDATEWLGKPVADPDLVVQHTSWSYPHR